VGGIKPHLYCLPILKKETDRLALLNAIATGTTRLFLGTDSAPHEQQNKETACGCAGVYTAHAAIELVAEALDSIDALEHLRGFCCRNGAQHYGLPVLDSPTVTLVKERWVVPDYYEFGEGKKLIPLRAGQSVAWKLVEE